MEKLSPKKQASKICSVEGCENPVSDKVIGLCNYHAKPLLGRESNLPGQAGRW